MPEIECPGCGHRALSVATRCPRCGHEFPPNLIQPLPSTADRHWVRWALMGAGGVALVIIIGQFGRYESVSGKPATRVATPARDSVATAVDAAPRDTAPRNAAPPVAPPTPPQQKPPQAKQQAQQEPPRPQTQPRPVAAPVGNQEQRYATVFVNVRRSRSPSATTMAVLNPGDAVLVDSLRRGWYRIVRDGQTLGYADRRFLATSPP